jgi:hypothetical protein
MAEEKKLASPSSEAYDVAEMAEIELNKIKASLRLDADEVDWMDEKGNQRNGTTLNIALVPSVRLTYNTGGDKWIVANAPIAFTFVKGGGILTGMVNTNELGQASCKIARFENANIENVIRATLTYKEKDFVYTFEGLQREFLFEPPANRATILVLEKSQDGVSADPLIFNPVYGKLKNVAFDFTMYNGSLMGDAFMKVYGGDTAAIRQLSLEKGVSYLVVVLNDCFNVYQPEFNGKPMKAFISEARATLRIVRVADGKILYETKVSRQKSDNTHAQGGTRQGAIVNALRSAAEEMEKKLGGEIGQISRIMTGTDK